MEGHGTLGRLDLQGQPPLNETLPKDKSETQADGDEVKRDTFPGERTVRADVQYRAPCWGARLWGAMAEGGPGRERTRKSWEAV